MATAKSGTKPQTFSFNAPGAANVLLAGDFTQWQERPIPMRRQLGGIWQVTVALPPGDHHYRFIVDGDWRDDPVCPVQVANPYGGLNAVRKVA
ncbi:MAG TPA: glycogen-binding domain-containing protein [Opitutaceae bacterium]|nr:glycogen-binding domain-containing protein [Opitutaceae bacterium]